MHGQQELGLTLRVTVWLSDANIQGEFLLEPVTSSSISQLPPQGLLIC
jgi:hypothetical protein